jgi:cation diffusion facilitator CzcD-associated flavoprotein CzcO
MQHRVECAKYDQQAKQWVLDVADLAAGTAQQISLPYTYVAEPSRRADKKGVLSQPFVETQLADMLAGGTSTHTARFLIVGPGPLCKPLQIDTPGADDFLAAPDHHIFHSSRWRHDVDLTGA